MPLAPAAQHTLFQCQLWHVRRAKELRYLAKKYPDAAAVKFFALRRKIRQHEKFIAAITPFVRLPLP